MAVLIYAIVAGIMSKKAVIYLGLWAEHVRLRQIKIAIGWLLLVAGLIAIIAAIPFESGMMALLGLAASFTAVIWLIVVVRVVTPKKIDDHLIWLKGINSDYLSQLPHWQSQS